MDGPEFDYRYRQKAFLSVNLPDRLGTATNLSPSLLKFRTSSAIPLWGRDSSVGITTRYGLDGPEIESR